MRFVLAVLLVAHGVAHLAGFVSSWKLATLAELPYKTAIFSGHLDVGDAGIRVMGVLWLLAALAFQVAAIAVATEAGWAVRFTLAGVIASLMLCAVGWPDARIGVAVNVGLVLLLAIGTRLHLADQVHAFEGGMSRMHDVARMMRWTAGGLGLIAAGYATVTGTTWYRYGQVPSASPDERDPLLDQFIPECEVAERHHVCVAAPAAITLSAAADIDLQQSTIVRAIFRARELVLGAEPDAGTRPKGLLAQMTSLGWRVLAEKPGREIVVGAVTQPWLPNVVFRGLAPEEFRAFQEPGYVKIVWTLRADPVGESESIFRTETRVTTTDQTARTKFRRYWASFSPGIVLIRRVMLGLLKTDAGRRARQAVHERS
jgi:hypothetical protein